MHSQALLAVFMAGVGRTALHTENEAESTTPPLPPSPSPCLLHTHTAPPAYLLAPSLRLHMSEFKLCHLATATQVVSLERKVQIFPIDFRKHYFGPHRKKGVGKWVLLVFYLWVGFNFCCSNLQAGNRRLGLCDSFDLQGRQKRWMLPSGDTLLHLILERKKYVISLETCAKDFSWFWPCKLALALVNQKFIFHINPVPRLYALSRHCTVCLRWDWFYIEGISLKSKPHGN